MRLPRIALAMLVTFLVTLALASTASADLGRVVAIGDSLASGTALGPAVGTYPRCGQTSGSYPQLAISRTKRAAFVDATCNGGHSGVFSNGWRGLGSTAADPWIPPQYDSLNGSEQVVIVGSGGNEAYFGEVMQYCMGHSDDYNANRCTSTYGADGAGLLAKTNGSKTLMAGVLDAVHARSPNAKVFLIGTPRIAPPDGAGCWPNPILTLDDAPVWSVWEDSLRQAMIDNVASRSSWATFVDVQAASGTTHTMCAAPSMRWMNPWTVENIQYPGLALHNTPWGADAIADIIVSAIKASGLNTGTPNAPTLTRTTQTASPNQTFTYSGAAGHTFKCRLDNAAYAPCPSSPVTLTGLSSGPHTYSVTQTDSSSRVSPAALVNFTIDTTPPLAPNVIRTSPTVSPTGSPTQTISYAGLESGGTYQCKLDNDAYALCPSSPLTLNSLTTGSHTFSVIHTDAAGNTGPANSVTWTVDRTPPGAPTVTRTSPTATPTKLTTQVITYSGAEGGGTFQCSLDNAAFSACSGSPVTLTGLGGGQHSFSVTQTDAFGNVGSATTVTWTVDVTPPGTPTVTRTLPSTSPTNSPTQTISYAGAEAGGTFQCKLDSAGYAACPSSPLTLGGLGAGSHSYSVTQTDAAGNVSAVGAVSWTVDVTPPPTPIVSGPSGVTSLNTASIFYSDSESGVSFLCKLDSALWAACPASPVSLSGLPDGPHTYSVTATDAAGNVSNAGTASWTVDPNGFTVSITASPSDPATVSTASFSFTATVTSGTTYECKLDSAAFTSCSSPRIYNNVPDGSHTFSVRANNASTSPATTPVVTRTWVVDATPPGAPSLSRTSPTASPTNQTTQTFALTAAEAGGVLNCKLDNAPATTCPSSPITVTGLPEGSHTYTVTQTDAAGNVGSASTVTWVVDLTPPATPTVVRTSPTANPTNSTAQSIGYGGFEIGATAQCKLDTAAFGPCPASPVTLSALGEGSHTFVVMQTDAAGNPSAAGSVSWTVDSIAPGAPTLVRDSPTASPTNLTTQTLSIIPAEGGGTLKCKLDSAAYANCPSNTIALSALGHGSHSYSVTQTDATGNTSQPATVTWTVDVIAPSAPGLGFNRPAVTKENSATIGYTPAEGGGTMQCAKDAGAWSTCPSNPVELTNLADGNHNFAIRQVDAAGNLGSGTQVSWLIDTVAPDAPTLTRTSPVTSPTNQTTASITIAASESGGTLRCKLDNAAYANCPSSPVALGGLGFGTHTYSVTQTDAAGNVGAVGSTTWTIEPDTTAPLAPTVTRTSPTANPTTATSQTISFTAAEPGGTLQCKLDANPYALCASSPVTINGLANGPHTVSVTQTDSSGNVSPAASVSWTVDNIAPAAPTITRTAPTGNPTPSTSQTLTYLGAEAGGTFQCKLDAASFAPCTGSPVSLSGLGDGPHSFSVVQTDAAGNLGSVATVTWVVDTAAPSQPTVSRTAPTANPTNLTTQSITYSGEPGGTFQCKLDAAPYGACPASPMTLSDLPDGTRSFSVTQTDPLGNVSQPTTITWTVDTVAPSAPSVTRTNPTGSPTNLTTQAIAYGGIEPGAAAQCKLDSAPAAPCAASPLNLTSLASGTHSFAVTQTDAAGNTSAPGTASWVVDVTPPPTPTVSGPSGTTGLTFATVSYSNVEPGVTFQCKLDTAVYAPCPASPVSLENLGNGTHTYFVTATDPAGNTSSAGTATWTVDPSGFTVSITSAPGSPSTEPSAAFAFASTITSGTTFECKLDLGSWAACSSPKNYSDLPDGSHTFSVRAVNGVQTTPEASRTWVIDSTAPGAPTVERSSPTVTPTSSTSQTLEFAGAEPGGVLTCKVNDSEYLTCPTGPVTLAALGDGVYTFSARQTDSAGNTGPASSVSWVVDATSPLAPTVVRTSPAASTTTLTSQTIAYSGEPAAVFECKFDGGAWTDCPGSPLSLTNLALGSHIVSVRQTDAAGNHSPATSVVWLIEAAPVDPTGPTDKPVIPLPDLPDPPPPGEKPSAAPKLSAVSPKSIVPARTGSPFSLSKKRSAGSFQVTLATSATIRVRLERVVSGRAALASTAWTEFKLKSGRTTIRISGRSAKRALTPGQYRVHLKVSGQSAATYSKTFRIKR